MSHLQSPWDASPPSTPTRNTCGSDTSRVFGGDVTNSSAQRMPLSVSLNQSAKEGHIATPEMDGGALCTPPMKERSTTTAATHEEVESSGRGRRRPSPSTSDGFSSSQSSSSSKRVRAPSSVTLPSDASLSRGRRYDHHHHHEDPDDPEEIEWCSDPDLAVGAHSTLRFPSALASLPASHIVSTTSFHVREMLLWHTKALKAVAEEQSRAPVRLRDDALGDLSLVRAEDFVDVDAISIIEPDDVTPLPPPTNLEEGHTT